MRFIVIVGDVVLNSFLEFKTIICQIQINIIVFKILSELFDWDVVFKYTFINRNISKAGKAGRRSWQSGLGTYGFQTSQKGSVVFS